MIRKMRNFPGRLLSLLQNLFGQKLHQSVFICFNSLFLSIASMRYIILIVSDFVWELCSFS